MPVQEQSALRSEGLREFVSHRPGFLIRWGIPVFFFLLVALVVGSYFIQYPDIVKARAKINSINPPKQVIAKNGGRLVKLFKGDNRDIKQGDIIGYIESTASHDEVLKLSAVLDTLQFFADSNRLEEIPRFWKSTKQSFAHLGELQQAHQSFMQGYITFKDYLSTGFYVTKKQMLNRDLGNTRKLLQTLQQQQDLQQQDLAITVQNYNVHDTLHNETLINDIEYRNQKSQLINKKMNIPQMNASIISNQSQQNALQKEMMELDNQIAQQRSLFIQTLNAYRNTVEEWKQKYLLLAPVNGKFVYAGFLDENQQLQAGEVIGFITNETNQYFVEMLIPQTNFGKVKPGQNVLLKFPSYPAQEFGSVKGRIEYIKNMPSDSGYLAKVSLPEGLMTNYKKIILFTEGLMAQAEIITEKKRLSDRFMSGFKNLIK
ncbi:MAG TPA: HlyD family efflux transporter periplasmic adaptor subunit [Chitinophagaceae bacterium]|nr:HlyD family efflux transporter periplasmic adaptor subunit [Chitinophagaceae bacterium]